MSRETIGLIAAVMVMLTPIIYYLTKMVSSYVTEKTNASKGIEQNVERIISLRKMVEEMDDDKVETSHCDDVHKRIDDDLKELKIITNTTQATVIRLEAKLEGYFNGGH